MSVLPLCVSAFLLSWFGKLYLLLFHCYLVSKTIGDAFCEDHCKILFSYGEVFLRTRGTTGLSA